MITMSEPKIEELTLEQKIAHCSDASIRLQLVRQLVEETKADLYVDVMKWESEVNESIPHILGSLMLSPIKYKCRIFFHLETEESQRKWIMKDGTIVELHYYGLGRDKETNRFKLMLADALQNVKVLQRSSSLEVRNVIMQRKHDMALPWQKIKVKDVSILFDLLKASQIKTEVVSEVTIRMTHKQTGIPITVVGPEHDYKALEAQCLFLLSREVAKFENGIEE